MVYNYILGQLILHNCVLTISENSLYTLYSLNVDTMFYTVIQSTELVSYYTVDIGLKIYIIIIIINRHDQVIVWATTSSTLQMAANLIQLFSFRANFHKEFELY